LAAAPRPAMILPKRTPVLLEAASDSTLFTNRLVGVVSIVVFTSAVFIAGYLIGYNSYPCTNTVAVANGPTETANLYGDFEASLQAVEAASQCPPCPGVLDASIPDASIMGEDDELMAMSSKAFACNVQQAMEDLTVAHNKVTKLTASHDKTPPRDRDRYASFGKKLENAQEDEKAFRGCMRTMMPDLLVYWDRKAKDGTLYQPDSNKKGITNDVLIQTAMEMDPEAVRDAEQATKMQAGLKTMMDKMAMGTNGVLTAEQSVQLKALHEQLGSHLYGDHVLKGPGGK